MITFRYLTGVGNNIVNVDILSFLNEVSNQLSIWGSPQLRYGQDTLADFDGIIRIRGDDPSELPTICKEFQAMGLPLSSKETLRVWNELIFDLYPADSVIKVLIAGEIRGSGLICRAGQRLYGGHLIINRLGIELSVSLTSIEIQSQLLGDFSSGLQALLAITSNLANADYVPTGWKLTLRPGMLYEEIYNGRDS